MLWYEPLEEEGVGHEALHEVVNDSYKHITRSSQRRMSIQRIRNKDGWFHATFMKGSAGRSRSERLTPLITKIMHEHLPTDARMEMWSGRSTGSWTCACGKTLTWGSRDEVGCLQWHMLACPLAEERKVRKRWAGPPALR